MLLPGALKKGLLNPPFHLSNFSASGARRGKFTVRMTPRTQWHLHLQSLVDQDAEVSANEPHAHGVALMCDLPQNDRTTRLLRGKHPPTLQHLSGKDLEALADTVAAPSKFPSFMMEIVFLMASVRRYARHDWHHMAPHYITCEKCPESVRNDAIADRNKRKQQKGARIKAQEATAGGFEVPVLPVALQADGYRETSLSRPMLNVPLPHSGVSTQEDFFHFDENTGEISVQPLTGFQGYQIESTSEYALPYPSSTYLTPNHDTWSMIQPTQMADTSYNNHPTSVPGDVPSSPFFTDLSLLPSLHGDNGYEDINVPQQMLINIMRWRDFIATAQTYRTPVGTNLSVQQTLDSFMHETNYVGAPYQMHQQNNIQQYEDTPIAYPPYMFSVDFNAQQTLAVPQFHGGYETNNLVDVPWQMAQSVSWPQTMQQLQMPQGNYSGQQMSVAESIYIG
ncbi:hypothetical protein C0991_007639 [Blastosporella zonata]|nr:hypothetical protein C0991_007639 [Blastosporella zonata]